MAALVLLNFPLVPLASNILVCLLQEKETLGCHPTVPGGRLTALAHRLTGWGRGDVRLGLGKEEAQRVVKESALALSLLAHTCKFVY